MSTTPTNPQQGPQTQPPQGVNKPNPPAPVIPVPTTPLPFPEEVTRAADPTTIRLSFNALLANMEAAIDMMKKLVAKIH